MFPSNFGEKLRHPEQNTRPTRPDIHIRPDNNYEDRFFEKVPNLGAQIDVSRSIDFGALSSSNISAGNSFFSQWEEVEERKMLETMKGGADRVLNRFQDAQEKRFEVRDVSPILKRRPSIGSKTNIQEQDSEQEPTVKESRMGVVQEVESRLPFERMRVESRAIETKQSPKKIPSEAINEPISPTRFNKTVESEFVQDFNGPDKESGMLRVSKYPSDVSEKTAVNDNLTHQNITKDQTKTLKNQKSVVYATIPEDKELEAGASYSFSSKQKHHQHQTKSSDVYFNVMIVGASGLGKSTFIDAFLNTKYSVAPVIRSSTASITELQGTRTYNQINFKMTMIDTPGYSVNRDMNGWFKNIKSYIRKKFHEYREEKQAMKKDKKKKDQHILIDKRVHAILYFMTGPRVSQTDLDIMKKLQDYCNIIPVLAKGDSYTPQEVIMMKKAFLQQAYDDKIDLFDFEDALKDEPQKWNQMSNGKFGPCPPFLIISSVKQIEITPKRFIYGRLYPWGVCNIENPDHSDFVLLQSLLGGYICYEAIQSTKFYYRKYFYNYEERQKAKLAEQTNKNISFGMAFAVGLVGAYLAIDRRIFR